jgi:oligopeptide/dipeptide ABC transporter ATP-binding protein
MTTSFAIETRGLRIGFPAPRGAGRSRVMAVDGVDLAVPAGTSTGLVGESGSGKTTFARAVVGEVAPDEGQVYVDGIPMRRRRSIADRRRMQMVFQNPSSSLNPRRRIEDMLMELLRVHGTVPPSARETRCRELIADVGLPMRVLDALPAALSDGQRQRVSIARALAVEPEILIADEITSALDVSVQAQVLQLLLDLRQRLGLSVLFISHNLAVVRQVCDQVAVMYLGRIVEHGPTEDIFTSPRHPYTKLLLDSVPRLGSAALAPQIPAEAPGLAEGHAGCRFRPRCADAAAVCATDEPALTGAVRDSHQAACHFAWSDGQR